MAEKKYLGIYLTGTGAAVVLLAPNGRLPRIESSFWLPKPEPQNEKNVTLADEIARICDERQWTCESSSIALDRTFYTHHRMRSRFRELQRVAETIRFDAEEAITVDITNLAVTFEVLAVDEAGSEVSVYAADKKAMSGVLAEFQKAGFDPLAFEPESATLARWLDAVVPRNERTGAMYVLFAGDACCLVVYAPGRDAPLIRTIIVPPGAATAALAREITLTVASLKLQAPLSAVRVFDLKGRTDLALLRQRLGVPVDPFDLMTAAGFTPAIVDQPLEPLAVAAACGAAMGDFIKSRRADFREDFSPYLGRTRIVDKTVKAISLALTFIVVAVGIYLQLRLFVINRDRQLLADTIAPDYRAAMHTQNVPPLSEAVNRLNSELRAVRGLKAGMLGQETVTGLFTNFLEAANALPRSVDLQLNSIRVTPRAITLSGSTDRPENTLALLKKVGDSPYLASENLTQQFKNGRDEFGVTILPRRSRPGAAHAGQN